VNPERPPISPMPERLATALREARAPEWMVQKARAGEYDDFQSHHPTPTHHLVEHCRSHGLDAIAERAVAGEFDATVEEADTWIETRVARLVQAMAGSPEPEACLVTTEGTGATSEGSKNGSTLRRRQPAVFSTRIALPIPEGTHEGDRPDEATGVT